MVWISSPDINLSISESGSKNWMTEELETITGGLPFVLARIDTTDSSFLFKNYETNEILGLDLHQFDVDLEQGAGRARIETAGRLGKSRFFALGEVEANESGHKIIIDLDVGVGRGKETPVSAIQAPSVSWWIKQNAHLFPVQGTFQGELELTGRLAAGDVQFELAAADLDEFSHYFDAWIELRDGLGPIRASGDLRISESDLDVRGLSLQIDSDNVKLDLSGDVSNLLAQIEAELKLHTAANQLDQIADIDQLKLDMPIPLNPGLVGFELSSSVSVHKGLLKLKNIDLELDQGNMKAGAQGNLSLDAEDLTIDGHVHVNSATSDELLKTLGMEDKIVASSGPLQFSADVSGKHKKYELSSTSLDIDRGKYVSSVAGTLNVAGDVPELNLTTEIKLNDLVLFRPVLGGLADEVLQSVSASLTTRLQGPISNLSAKNTNLKLTRADRTITVDAEINGYPNDIRSNASFQYTVESSFNLSDYFPALGPMQVDGPLKLDGSATFEDQELYIKNASLTGDKAEIGASAKIDFSYSPPRIHVVAEAEKFFSRLVSRDPDYKEATQKHDETVPAAANEPDASKKKSKEPKIDPGVAFRAYTDAIDINTDWIKDLNLYVSFNAAQAQLGDYDFSDMWVILDAREGILTLAHYEVKLAGRPMLISGTVDTNPEPPLYRFSGEIEGETLEELLKLEPGLITGGVLTGEFNLEGQGRTLGATIETLNGKALVNMGPVTIASRLLSVISSDMLSSILGGIVNTKERQGSKYQCGVLGVDIQNGMARADNSITLQAKDYNLAGKGKIDLNTGYVDITVKPRARKGLGLSLSTLVGGFSIKGHMATPKFGVSGGGLVTAALTGYALTPTVAAAAANPVTATVVATGFVALGLIDRVTSSRYTCKNTVKRIERARQRQSQPRSRSPHSGKNFS